MQSSDAHDTSGVGGCGGNDGGGHSDWDLRALPLPPGLVREQEAGLLQFLRLDGFSVLMRAMQQQVQKLKVKSAFLLQNLLVGHPEHKGEVAERDLWGLRAGVGAFLLTPAALPQELFALWGWSSSWWPL